MKRKLLSTSISLLIVGPSAVLAQTNANLEIYGTADLTTERVSAEGSSVTTGTPNKPARVRVSSNSSLLGFRGATDISKDLKGIFQLETSVTASSSGTAPAAGSGAASGLFSSARDTYVGASLANVGTLKLGILSAAGRWVNGIGDYSPGYTGINANQGITAHNGGATGKDAFFNGRLNNALGFESASWGGFNVRGYYGAGQNTSNSGVTPELADKTYSLGLGWKRDFIELRYAQEVRNDMGTLNNTTANDTKDTMQRFGVAITLPSKTSFGVLVDSKEFEDSTANTAATKSRLKRESWQVGVKQEFGRHQVYAGYGQGSDITCTLGNGVGCSSATTNNTGGNQVILGYNYVYSPELMLIGYFSKVTNQANARYDYDVSGISPALGASPTGYGIGLRYTFGKKFL